MTRPDDRHYTVELHASAERVPQIRRIVAAHLRYWNLELHIPPVCRGVAELLTNVHRHIGPGARCVVELRWSGRHLTVSVTDDGPRLPRLVSAAGTGLAAVAALSDSWGTCPTADGKVVWFTRRVSAAVKSPLPGRTPLRSVPDAKSPAALPEPVPEPSPEAGHGPQPPAPEPASPDPAPVAAPAASTEASLV